MSSTTNIDHTGIGKILETSILKVPKYQRSYSWTDREIDDLWKDLNRAINDEEEEKDYFLGTIVLTLSESSKLVVVDGQQRLASVTMIYAAMRDYLLHIQENITAKGIEETFLTNRDRWSHTSTAKLELSAEDGLFFKNHVLETPDSVCRKLAIISKTSPDSHKRIAKAFQKLSEYLKILAEGVSESLKVLKRWDTFLQDSAKVIVLQVEDESSAFQIFETLNDRGLDLAVTDLLKNYLFGKAGPEYLEAVSLHWRTAVAKIDDGDERVFKRFVHHFWSSKYGLTRERLLYKNIKEVVKSRNGALTFASELSSSSSNYAAILNSDASFWNQMGSVAKHAVSTLKELKLEQYKPLLLACMDTMEANRPKEMEKVLSALVSWSVRFRITQQFGTSKLEHFYGNGGKLVRDRKLKTASEIISVLRDTVPSDIEFQTAFKDLREENARLARYYLLEIEKIARRESGIVDISNPDEKINNLEHVFPKESNASEWPSFTSEIGPVYLYRLGNQTILSKRVNQQIGSSAFLKKQPEFAKSELLITKKISLEKDWTPSEIDKHQEWLAGLAILAWPING